ncbi:hypothetical protein AB0F42_08865 [Streptomyces buecherae]|uniref:hypothetical protein n=1 Tax=Streptomyces buecherae TaxID=2763006 RepID=UPI0033FE4D0E
MRFARTLQLPEHHLRLVWSDELEIRIGLPQHSQAVVVTVNAASDAVLSQR